MAVEFSVSLDDENMEESLISLIKLLNDAASGIDGMSDGVDKVDNKLDEGGATAKTFGERLKSAKERGIDGMRVGAAAALGVLGGLFGSMAGGVVAIGNLSKAGSEQEIVFDRLSASVNNSSDSVEDARQKWGALQDLISDAGARTDFGDEEISDALSTYIDKTGDATVSTGELNTILGIAAQRGKDASAAAEILAKARSGDVEALKDLTPLTKDQTASLAREKDESKRAAAAVAILEAQYGGLADTTGTARNSLKELDDVKGDVIQKAGLLINQLGIVQAILDPVNKLFREGEQAIGDNSMQVQSLVLELTEGLVTGLEVTTEAGYFAVDSALALKAGLISIGEGGKIALSVTEIVGRGLISFGTDVLGAVLGKIGEFSETAEDVARRIGADDLADQIAGAGDAVDGFKASVDEVATANIAGISEELDNIETSGKAIAEEMDKYAKQSEEARQVANKLHDVTGEMRGNLARARSEMKPLSDGYKEAAEGAKNLNEQTKQVGENVEKSAPKSNVIDLQERRLELERQLLRAKIDGNQEEAIRLRWVLSLNEANEARANAASEEIANLEEGNALLAADMERRQALADLEAASAAALLEQERALAEERERSRAARIEAAEAERDIILDAASILERALTGIEGDAGNLVGALGAVSAGLADAASQYEVLRASGVSSDDALASSASVAAAAISAATNKGIDDKGRAAKIDALVAAAQGAFLIAMGNPVQGGAVLATVPAFLLASAQAGQSGGGAGGGGGGGGTAGAGVARVDPEREREALARSITRGINDRGQDGGGTVVKLFMNNNTFLEESPAMERRISEAARRGAEAQGRF